MLEEAIHGHQAIALADTDTTLSVANGSTDQARQSMLTFTGTLTAARNIVVPAVSHRYQVHNGTAKALTLKTSGGSGAAVPAGCTASVWCDGTNCWLGGPAVDRASGALTVTATSAVAWGLDIRGRSSDGVAVVRLGSNDGATEYARLQSKNDGTVALYTGNSGGSAGPKVLETSTTGEARFSQPTRFFANALAQSDSNPSVACHRPGLSKAAGIVLDSSANLLFASVDGNGGHLSTRGYFTETGNFVAGGTITSSDPRLKRDIEPLAPGEAAEKVAALAGAVARFRWREGICDGGAAQQLGVMADRVRAALPEAVHEGIEGYLGVADRPLVAVLLRAVAELQARVDALEAARGA